MKKKKKLKRYKVSSNDSMCLAVSVVSHPAVESSFVVLGEQKPEKFVASEVEGKHMIYGCALRADFPIYRRNDEDGEYLLSFDAEAIDRISKEYFKNGFQKSWTEAHEDEVKGLTITESWIKTSQTMDKSVALGLDPDIACGSWFIGCYCENEEIYEKCKNGEYNGFSVEALISMEEFEAMIEETEDKEKMETIEMLSELDNKQFWKKLKEMIKDAFAKEEKEEEVVMEETPAAEPVVEEPIQTPAEPQISPVEPSNPAEVIENKNEPKNEPTEPENKPNEEPKSDNHLEELLKNLQAEVAALKELNQGLKKQVKELEKEPSAKPVNTVAGATKGDTYSNWRDTMRNLLH